MIDEYKLLRVQINDTKSTVTSLATNIETQIETILATYFTNDQEDYELFCHLFYPNDVELTFGNKIKIFERFLNKIEPEYLKKKPDLIKALDRVRRLRNKFAHSLNPNTEQLKELVGKPYFILNYVEDGLRREDQFTFKDIEERFKDMNKIVTELIQIFERINPKK